MIEPTGRPTLPPEVSPAPAPLPTVLRIRQAMTAHRAEALRSTEVRITAARRRDLLRECGLDEDLPWGDRDRVWGLPLVPDEALPANPGFAVLAAPARV